MKTLPKVFLVVATSATLPMVVNADIAWTGAANDGGNVLTDGNWDGGTVPGASDTAIIGDAPDAVLSSGTATWKLLTIGSAADLTGTLKVTGGELNVSPGSSANITAITLGSVNKASSVLEIDGGTVNAYSLNTPNYSAANIVNMKSGTLNITRWVDWGRNANGSSTFNQSGGTVNVGGNLWIGRDDSGTGVWNMSGGTLKNTGGTFELAHVAGTTGLFTLNGGDVEVTGRIYIGNSGSGTFNLESGDITANDFLWVSRNSGSRGYLNQSGGTISVVSDKDLSVGVTDGSAGRFVQTAGSVASPNSHMYIGSNGRGTFDIGGTVTMGSAKGIYIGNTATGSGEVRLKSGGALTTNFLKPAVDAARGAVAFGAGTLNATAANATFVRGLNGLVFDPGSFTLNTGYDVAIFGCSETFGSAQSEMRKTGSGTLTVDKLPPVGNLAIDNGSVALSADNTPTVSAVNAAEGNVYPESPSAALKADNYLLHRWTFNGHGLDVVGTNHADIVGSGLISYTNSNTAVNLPGGARGTSWIDLGLNAIPLDGSPFTIEVWATYNAYQKWSRIFSFGCDNGTDGSGMTAGAFVSFGGTKATGVAVAAAYPTAKTSSQGLYNISLNQLTSGTAYHVAMTFAPQSNGKWLISAYIYNADTGALVGSTTKADVDWSPTAAMSAHFWLGHSHWTADYDASAGYNEVRVWAAALSQAQIEANGTLGPDALPVLSDTASQGIVGNIEIASGATLDLGGNSAVAGGISGAGTLQNGTLTVTKSLTLTAGQTLTVASGATLDLTGVTDVSITNPEDLPDGGWTFATSSSGGIPAAEPIRLSGDLAGYYLYLKGNKATIGKPGLMIIVR